MPLSPNSTGGGMKIEIELDDQTIGALADAIAERIQATPADRHLSRDYMTVAEAAE